MRVQYKWNVFKNIGDYFINARLRNVITNKAHIQVHLKGEQVNPFEFPVFREVTKGKEVVEQVFRGCLDCVIEGGMCDKHQRNPRQCDVCNGIKEKKATMKRRCFECIFGPKQGYTEQAWDNPHRMGNQEKRRVMELKAPRPSQLQEDRVEEDPEASAATTSEESRVASLCS